MVAAAACGRWATRNLNTLIDFRYARRHEARNGEQGRGSDQFGAAADDIVLRMPMGTIITDLDAGAVLAELLVPGEKVLLAKGGDGGFGNLHFKTSTNRAPRQKTPGWPGEARKLKLELRVLADVGLLGMPNAGKSTLIAAISNARPKIADYPFTTLHPNLGVVRVAPEQSFVVADIPGLIEGAAEGAGLGHLFLRHLQRTHLLLHVVDFAPFDESVDPVAQAKAIVAELKKYDAALHDKPRWIVLNKLDMVPAEERAKRVKDFVKTLQVEGAGVRDLGPDARRLRAADSRRLPACLGDAQPAGRTLPDPRFPAAANGRSRTPSMTEALARRAPHRRQGRLQPRDRRGPRPRRRGHRPLVPADRACWPAQGREVVMVSSGAIAEGMKRLGWTARPKEIHELQAAAAVGQMGLAQIYETQLRAHGMRSAQVLLTHADLADRERYLNARSTLVTLLGLKVVPVINENDTVVNDEIKFGDNDTLAALVANLVEADALVILTDQRGLYAADPRKDPGARFIDEARAGAPELERMAGGAGSSIGRGGMLTKILAAKRAARSGASTVIASGREPDVLLRLAAGEAIGTALLATTPKLAARKQWMADHLQLRGAVLVDDGAVGKLRDEGKSLLPIGMVEVQGEFARGDVIAVRSLAGRRGGARAGQLRQLRGEVDRPQAVERVRAPARFHRRAGDDPPRQHGSGLRAAGRRRTALIRADPARRPGRQSFNSPRARESRAPTTARRR